MEFIKKNCIGMLTLIIGLGLMAASDKTGSAPVGMITGFMLSIIGGLLVHIRMNVLSHE